MAIQFKRNPLLQLSLLALAASNLIPSLCAAGVTDLATAPLVTSSTTQIRPNLMFILDDSGSMDWDYLPDDAGNFQGKYGFVSSQCNGVYYNPSITYQLPVDATGASYAASSFTSAKKDGFNSSSSSVNLSTSFKAYSGDTAQSAYYYQYTGTQTSKTYLTTTSTFYKECNSNFGSNPGQGVFTKVTVSSTSGPGGTDERQNFANWYTYYRTRMQMMKSSVSLAFKPIDANYRVGYMSINNNTGSDFLNIDTFNSTQKSNWYSKLFAATPNNGTPLRSALSTAGLIYGGVLNGTSFNGGTVSDPIQYSCQQNFTILSTDGYWNTGHDSGCSGRNGAGCTLAQNVGVGNQDGTELRPRFDGATSTVTTATPTTTVTQQQTVTPQTTAKVWNRYVTSSSATPNCSVPLTSSCLQDNGQNSYGGTRTWCMETNNNKGSDCTSAFGTGTPKAYACRGRNNSTNTPGGVDLGCVTDGGGQQWCIFNGNTTPGTSSCSQVYSGNSLYLCKASATNGYTVTTQTQAATETIVSTVTSVDDVTTTSTQTVVTANGVITSNTTTSSTSTTNVSSSTSTTSDTWGAWSNSGSPTTTCQASPSSGTSSAVQISSNTTPGTSTVTTLSTTGPTVGTPTVTTTSSGGTSDTLADVAMYYYKTDLRTSSNHPTGALGTSVTNDNVPSTSTDPANWQHMTTFTLGLGAQGRMTYSSTYMTDVAGDFYNVRVGTKNNGSSSPCSWSGANQVCNWPTPGSNNVENIDDLWHAAVDGHGLYFSATNPTSLASGLSGALAGVSARVGAAAAATTSNPNVTSGDNFVFSSTFTTADWTGELYRQQIDTTTGILSTTLDWVVSSCTAPAGYTLSSTACNNLLDNVAYASRKIYTFDSGNSKGISSCEPNNANSSSNQLKCFTYADLTTAEQAYFGSSAVSLLSQYGSLSSANQTSMAGTNLVNYLRGDRTNEGTLYRSRNHVLGDIVSAEAVYVKTPMYSYNDTGYTTFQSNNASRQGVVYTAANDGMLHAFDSSSGQELWAYIPSMVMPNLYNLSDNNYATHHRYFVDGTPIAGDVCTTTFNTSTSKYDCGGASSWHTIVVGGLSGGGSGYYALDVTDPANPKALWEFQHANMGYSFGNPVITKLPNGKWVVMFTSGYNNSNGNGYLYVLDALTGANADTALFPVATGAGSASTPSGFAKITAWVDDPMHDNTTLRVYGGDVLGNLWRIDLSATTPAALQLANFNVGGTPQPITTKPELGMVGTEVVVFVGTGRYLGASDLTNTDQQSFYAIKDPLGTTGWGNVRSSALLFQQTLSTGSSTTRTITPNSHTINFNTDIGWYIDFPNAGSGNGSERNNTDPQLGLGTLVFTTNIPTADACTVGGYSWIYFIDYRTGLSVSTSGGTAGQKLGNALATRPVFVRLPNNTVETLTRMSDGSTIKTDVPINAAGINMRRISWRELINE